MIEEVKDDDEACKREIYWINYYKSCVGFIDSNGYNATLGGDGKRYYNYQDLADKYKELKTIKAVSKFYNCDEQTVRNALQEQSIPINKNGKLKFKPIKRIDPKTEEEKEYSSALEAAKDFPDKAIETARKNISRALNSGGTAYGFKWEFLKDI